MRFRLDREHGMASAQVVLVTPVLLLGIMLVFQFAMYEHASHVVTAAAQHGAAAAQAERGSEAAGRRGAQAFLGAAGSGLLGAPEVSVSRSAERTRVVVRAAVVSLVPGFAFTVTGVADGPSERWRAPSER